MRERVRLLLMVWQAAFCDECCRQMTAFLRDRSTSMLYRVAPGDSGHRHVMSSIVKLGDKDG